MNSILLFPSWKESSNTIELQTGKVPLEEEVGSWPPSNLIFYNIWEFMFKNFIPTLQKLKSPHPNLKVGFRTQKYNGYLAHFCGRWSHSKKKC